MTTISGDSNNNILSGTNSADLISGGSGDDTLSGGNGNDLLLGGSGDDVIDGGNGNDVISGGSGDDAIDGGNGNDLISGGSGDDVIDGGNGDDTIDGGSGNDVISGGSGNDVLIGVGGADWLQGGAGNDMFAYLSASDSNAIAWDRIIDFAQGRDKIDLSELLGQTTDLAWGNKVAVHNGAWYQNSGSSTFVFADINNDGKADLKIELKNTSGLQLTSSDFLGVGMAPVVNDAATITGDNSGNVAEDGIVLAAGNLNVADVDTGEAVFQAVAPESLAGTYGNFTFNELTGAWTYTLDQSKADSLTENQQVTDALMVKSLDGTASETIAVDITGANDDATINGVTSGAVMEAGGVANGTPGTPDASGDLVVSDAGEAMFQAVAPGSLAGTYGNFTFDAGAWTYTLDQGKADSLTENELATDALTVTSLDGSASKTITVNITGANDAPVAMADDGNASDGGNVLTNDTDLDTGDKPNLKVASFGGMDVDGDAFVAGTFGSILIVDDGTWAYTLDDWNPNTTPPAQDATDEFNYTTVDAHGATSSSTLTVHVTGTGAAPVVTSFTSSAAAVTVTDTPDTTAGGNNAPVAVADDANFKTTGTFGNVVDNDTDLDTGDSLFVTEVNGNAVDGDAYAFGSYGSLFMTDAGYWCYTLNNAGTDALAQGTSVDDVFGYTMADTDGATASSTLTIHIGDFIL